MATNGNYTPPDEQEAAVEQSSSGPAATNDGASATVGTPSKDEVGWYFVESYYTTLAKNPEKLHLFYGKRSQFVNGMEAEVAPVSVGRQSIQERIKSLDFQDTKVRITNVDTQASFDNIFIQVIGESAHKDATEPRKFVQSFVLAPQNTGYWVVNDVLRYILEDEDEDEAAAAADAAAEPEAQPEKEQPAVEEAVETAQPEAEAKVEKTPEEAAAPAIDPTVVDKRLEEVSAAPQDAASSNGDAEPAAAESVKAPEATVEEPAADPEATAKEIAEEDIKEPEKPADPSPTPVVPTKAPAAPAPQPQKPSSWAGLLKGPSSKVAVPIPKTATPPAGAKAKAPVPVAATPQPAAPAPAPAAAPVPAPAPAPASAKEPEAEAPAAKDDWKSVVRQNRPQSISQSPSDNNGTLGYVKFVTEKVKSEDLKAALAAHGELTYFDINRQKNCAFVEFANAAGYQAAVSANPHIVNGEHIVVEPRRPKATAYGGSNYSAGGRGNASGRGRGGFEGGNRSGSQGNPRGNFSGGQGRGRGSVRGRGASQATA
ncbi:NTF2 and RRM domain-containing protein [Colletotrichum sojae]|uniref:NTF2 and RRM domain-containing protein n=1 Tax=Colletotrichum sojae TaxID=2175907 RepID=A0A8H6JPX4_9PEZI|nr:NTF2 and RRM domain-containing protein [Colletotrichum sojae]